MRCLIGFDTLYSLFDQICTLPFLVAWFPCKHQGAADTTISATDACR